MQSRQGAAAEPTSGKTAATMIIAVGAENTTPPYIGKINKYKKRFITKSSSCRRRLKPLRKLKTMRALVSQYIQAHSISTRLFRNLLKLINKTNWMAPLP